MEVKIRIRERVAVCVENGILTAMNNGDTVVFDFDEEWEPESTTATRTARFIFDGRNYADIVFNGNTCPLPCFSKAGNIYVGVYWGDIRSTTPAMITFTPSALSSEDFPADPPEDVYNQIIALMNDKVNAEDLQSEVKRLAEEEGLATEEYVNQQLSLISQKVDTALPTANAAINAANAASETADSASQKADTALSMASSAVSNVSSAIARISALEESAGETVTDEQIATAVETYMAENPAASSGKSAYEIAVDNGFEGSESEWLASLKGEKGTTGSTGDAGKNAYEYAKEGGYTGTEAEFAELLANAIDERKLTLGLHTDGLFYIFVNDEPVGNGIALPSGDSGDVVGNVDSENNIIVTGSLPDGTYTVKYEMEDGSTIDIGELVLDTNVYYSVSNNLTNCTNGNSAAEVIEGESYSATISANDGYTLSSVAVTMGGVDVSADVVSSGNISITEVTGNIVITAVAEETAEPTNLFTVDGDGYIESGRCSSTGEDRTDATSCFVTNYIDVEYGDIVYIKGYQTPTASGAYCGVKYTDGTTGGFMLETETTIVTDFSLADGIAQFTIDAENADYMRFTILKPSSLDDIIINIKRNGEYL